MSVALPAMWLALVVGAAVRFRPPPVRRERAVGGVSSDPAMLLTRVGRRTLERLPLLAPASARWVGASLLLSVLAAPLVGPGVAVALPVSLAIGRVVGGRSEALAADRELDAVGLIAELMGVAISSGMAPGAALPAVLRRVRPGESSSLGTAVADLERGRAFATVMSTWGNPGSPTAELAALLRSADRDGVAIVDGLERLGRDLGRRRRRASEVRARRLPVLMLLPLVTCVLPAFGLVTVVPMVAVGLDRLATVP